MTRRNITCLSKGMANGSFRLLKRNQVVGKLADAMLILFDDLTIGYKEKDAYVTVSLILVTLRV